MLLSKSRRLASGFFIGWVTCGFSDLLVGEVLDVAAAGVSSFIWVNALSKLTLASAFVFRFSLLSSALS